MIRYVTALYANINNVQLTWSCHHMHKEMVKQNSSLKVMGYH